MPKKQKVSKEQLMEENNRIEEEQQMEAKASLEPQREETAHADSQYADSQHDSQHVDHPDAPQETVTSTQSTKRTSGAPRSVCAMHKVVMKKAQGKKFKVRYNEIGVPIGDTRHPLQSYIGMLARTMVPIDIPSWPHVDPELKQKLWDDIQNTFKVVPESQKHVLQSAGSKWRQFKTDLTTKYVIPYVGQKKKLAKPPKKYGFVDKGAWKRFVAEINKEQSGKVKRRKYPHRASKKGYIGLEEEEVNSGRLEPGEVPDHAILWKKARKPKDPTIVIDEELVKINEKIDSLLEMKHKGEFKPSVSSDVLSTALETPEHAGRVRGVGNFVSPSTYFNLPKGKRIRVTQDELLARDKKRDDEFEKRTQEFDKKTETLISEIAQLKALFNVSNFHSPILSDKASCLGEKEQQLDEELKLKSKPLASKELIPDIDRDDDCFAFDPNDPPPSEIKGPRFCELVVDNIDNKVAFGMVIDDGDMSELVHGLPLNLGFLRVSVDGVKNPDALVSVPIAGEIETVDQAVGSYLMWPKDLIIFTPTIEKKKELQKKKEPQKKKGELQRVHALFDTLKMNENVPGRFKLLYKHASCFMKESGVSIQLPCDDELFGIGRTIFLLHENLIALLEFKMIGQAIISTYMSYLHTRKKDSLELYAFVDPSIHKLNDEFEAYIVQRLKDGVLHINFMPYNHDSHWILIIIWESEIFILNPLSHSTHFPELEQALMRAVRSFNAQTGRVNKNPKVKNLPGSPKQPGGIERGYVVMRYMKEIIEDKEMKLINLWGTKHRKTYTKEELNVVRFEALDYIQAIM